jgi:hypothetical protein
MPNNIKLLGLLLILAFISYLVMDKKVSEIDSEQKLIPELELHINDIDTIILGKNNQKVSLYKKSGIWRVAEVDDYFADTNQVANLLLGLRKMTLKEKKTKNPDNFAKLFLAESGNNAGTFIKIYKGELEVANISIGKEALRSNGAYVRINSESQTWLSDGLISVNLDANAWISKIILDVDNRQIKSIKFSPTDRSEFSINKLTPNDTKFILKDIPINRKLRADIDLNNLAGGLKKLNINSVIKLPEITNEFLTNKVEYQLFSGMIFTLHLYKNDSKYQLKIIQDNAETGQNQSKLLQQWLFQISEYKYNTLNISLSDYLEEDV